MNYLKLLVIVCVATAFSNLCLAVAGTDAQIVASGTGLAISKADLLKLDVTLQARQSKATDATETIAGQYRILLKALNTMGLAQADIWTSRFGVEPNWEVEKKGQSRKLIGWIATHVVTVRVRDISKAGEVVDSAMDAGASGVGGVTYYVENPDSLQQLALSEAVRNAQDRAKTMALAAGGRLGELIDLSTEPLQPREGSIQMWATGITSSDVRSGVTGTSLAAREITVGTTAYGRWRFIAREP